MIIFWFWVLTLCILYYETNNTSDNLFHIAAEVCVMVGVTAEMAASPHNSGVGAKLPIDGSFIRPRTNLELGPAPTNRFDQGHTNIF